MSDFNISSWKKNQYLDEAGLLSEATLPMPNFFYKMWEIISKNLDAQAVASGDRMSYFSAEFPTASSFEMYMRKQLQGSQLNEAPGSTLNLTKDDMDKLHKDGKLEIDGHKLLFKVNEATNYESLKGEFKEKFGYKAYMSAKDLTILHKDDIPEDKFEEMIQWVESKGYKVNRDQSHAWYDWEDGERDFYPRIRLY